jgi:hypothetical protein
VALRITLANVLSSTAPMIGTSMNGGHTATATRIPAPDMTKDGRAFHNRRSNAATAIPTTTATETTITKTS